MKKYCIYAVLIFSCASCRTYQMLDGKSRPVYFSADTSVFNDTDFSKLSVGYEDLHNLTGNFINVVDVKKGEISKAIINQPTFFSAYDLFLVYPGEHITISKGRYNDFTFIKRHGSKRRNNELSFFKTLDKIKSVPFFGHRYPLEQVLTLESELKKQIPQFADKLHYQFDSLAKADRVSRKFKKIGRAFINTQAQDYANLYGLYLVNRDTLEAYGLYKERCKQLISLLYTNIKPPKFSGQFTVLNQMANDILPNKVQRIKNENEFQTCFDSVENNFPGFAKDYILSQLMYAAYNNRVVISDEYLSKYESECSDKGYKKLVYQVKLQHERNDKESVVLRVDGTAASLENIVSKYKGKVILLDFWATWCIPCREEMPFLKKLTQEYGNKGVVFLSLSIDKEVQRWQKVMLSNNYEITNSFLLTNEKKSSFLKNFEINTIPRYMVINKEGKIINDDSPRPSDPKLKELLDRNLR